MISPGISMVQPKTFFRNKNAPLKLMLYDSFCYSLPFFISKIIFCILLNSKHVIFKLINWSLCNPCLIKTFTMHRCFLIIWNFYIKIMQPRLLRALSTKSFRFSKSYGLHSYKATSRAPPQFLYVIYYTS